MEQTGIEIGTPGTYRIGSDNYGGVILETRTNKHGICEVLFDHDSENMGTKVFTLRKDGKWREKARKGFRQRPGELIIGARKTVLDPGF